ncbi:MAG: deoxynucleoside kinase [bacterium]|nr:deoxynucleoside kinase [bacterium]
MGRGKFVMIDGLDGSGKGVAVNALKEWAELQAMKVLDLREYCKNHELPKPDEVKDYDVIVSSEPTYSFVGKAIREELIKANDRNYSAWTIANAFALDREILYNRVIIPAIKEGKFIFQERGVVSSIIYHPVQDRIQLSELLKMAGNKLAMQNAPSLLVVAQASPETVISRLHTRKKKDNSIFDNLSFQRKIEERYNSPWLKTLFERHGSKVIYIDTDAPKTVEDTKQATIEAWENFIKNQ